MLIIVYLVSFFAMIIFLLKFGLILVELAIRLFIWSIQAIITLGNLGLRFICMLLSSTLSKGCDAMVYANDIYVRHNTSPVSTPSFTSTSSPSATSITTTSSSTSTNVSNNEVLQYSMDYVLENYRLADSELLVEYQKCIYARNYQRCNEMIHAIRQSHRSNI